MEKYSFPKDFLWGASCSAFQLEGAPLADGKTYNIREACFHSPEYNKKFQDQWGPDLGADFYHHYPEDIALFKELGLKAFRFSIAWSRICPDKSCKPNQAGIDYYNNMISELLKAGITPFFDLLHSDLPQWVYEEGGFADPKFIDYFTKYAEICFREFGDRVAYFSTVNEPKMSVYGAYAQARGVPYLKDMGLAMQATTNMILAHFNAVRLCRELCPNAKIGSVHNSGMTYPITNHPDDVARSEYLMQRQQIFLYPMMHGVYPELILTGEEGPYITEQMKAEIKKNFIPADFYGINYYCPGHVESPEHKAQRTTPFDSGKKKDAYGFENDPNGLKDLSRYLAKWYGDTPCLITENGYTTRRPVDASHPATFDVENTLHDPERIDYIRGHLHVCSDIIQSGFPLKGYFYWSVMDCWESTMGYGYPMGLIAVHFPTLERKPRDSFYYYQKVIQDGFVDE